MISFQVYFFVFTATIILAMAVPASAFTSTHRIRTCRTSLEMVSREEYLRPHFQATTTTTTTTSASVAAANMLQQRKFSTSPIRRPALRSSMEQRVHDYCETKGGCDLEEMARLMEDFQTMNHNDASLFDTEEVDLKQHLRRMHEIADMEEH